MTSCISSTAEPVAAFDLADEGPQLADYLPHCTTIADIGDATGQMALFDHILADRRTTKIIDLSHRTFKDFFTIAEKIGFFAEARRQGIEPLILFMIDPGQKSAKAYAILRRWLMEAALLPVRNQIVAKGIPSCAAFPNESAVPVSLEMPVLGASLRTLVDQESFRSPGSGAPRRFRCRCGWTTSCGRGSSATFSSSGRSSSG